MSHNYHLRPNVKGRIQRRVDPHSTALGEQNRDKAVAVPSETEQGVHLSFDPERSLSPEHGRVIEPQRVKASEEAMVIEISDSDSSDSELSSLDTIAQDTYCSEYWPSSPPHAPKAPRIRQGNWHEESAPSSLSAIDSMAPFAGRGQALRSQLDVDQVRQRVMEMEEQQQRHEGPRHAEGEQAERGRREQILMLRRDYERRVAQFREERAELFDSQGGFEGERYAASARETIGARAENNLRGFSRPPSPLGGGAGPSRCAERYRRHEVEKTVTPKSLQEANVAEVSSAAHSPFVVVAKRVPKLGPCGTVVMDHETGTEKLETRRYRVRADELESIDEDGDSVMGSDEYYVCNSFAM